MCELLAPAGSYESILAAVNAGADAVYTGGRMFGARAYADNPDEEQLIRGIEYCHIHGRKLYLTVNTLLKEQELETMLYPYLRPFYENGADGVIVQDLGVMRFVQEYFPGLPVHASTQMTVTALEGARMLRQQGVARVVVARELSLEEIREIAEESGIEVEAFVHGAMCYSYSGQCLFSSLIGGRSGNRGRCAQPCRLPYHVSDSPAQGEFLLSMKDMCALDILPELLDAGIASLKIEGRMKRPEYTAGVVSIYRKYIDLCRESAGRDYRVEDEDRNALLDLYNRGGFSEGYYHVHNGRDMMSMYRPNHRGTEAVRVSGGKNGRASFTALETLGRGDVIEFAPGREITLRDPVKKGGAVRFPGGKGYRAEKGVLYRTKNAGLLGQIKARYLDCEPQESLRGELVVRADGPAALRLTCRGVQVECLAEIAQPARNQPTDEETLRRQMSKTGNTPFRFEELKISLEDGLFVPVAGLNELRRAGLEMLRERLLADGRRRDAVELRQRSIQKSPGKERAGDARMNVLVTTAEQLDALLECAEIQLDTVYLDSLIFALISEQDHGYKADGGSGAKGSRRIPDAQQLVREVKRRGWRCFLNCPAVLRSRERAFLSEDRMQAVLSGMDGFLLHTLDELAFFRDFVRENRLTAVLAADDNLYAYNSGAVSFLRGQGVTRFTFPAELNARELGESKRAAAELNIYGYQALMQSAQCVVKNTGRCTKIPAITYLTDRKRAGFPVLNRCPFCCNTIYNSVPLQLWGCRDEIARLAPDYVRFSFTIESKEETARVLKIGTAVWRGEELPDSRMEGAFSDGTRGHFRRGVE